MDRDPAAFAQTMRLVRESFAGGDPSACRAHLEAARALEPEAPDVARWQARLAWRDNDWEALLEAAAAFPDVRADREMAQLRARALSNLKRWPEAVEAWQAVTELRPGWAEAVSQLARAQWRAKRAYAAAHTAARLRALEDRPSQVLAARLALERGQMGEAHELYAALAAADAARVEEELHHHERKSDFAAVAVIAGALGRRSDGEPFRKKAAAVARDLLPRAASAERQGRADIAYVEYAAMLAVEPTNILAQTASRRIVKFLHDTAKTQYAAGERDAARESYAAILALAPKDGRALSGLAQVEMAAQNWLAAADAWDGLLALSAHDEKALTQRARALDRACAYERAIAAWRAVQVADPANSEANLALARLGSRIVKAARQALEQGDALVAAELLFLARQDAADPDEVERRLDQVLRQLRKQMRQAYKDRRFAAVVAQGRVAVRIAAGDADAQRLLAQAAMRTHDFAVAAKAWERVAELSPEHADKANQERARCHERLGSADAAGFGAEQAGEA